MQIETIEAKKYRAPRLKNVAAYTRVSDEGERLAHSLEAQVQHYKDMIPTTKDWHLFGVYSDEYITGTTNNRPRFQQLISDCEAGKIDIVITKSISRFSRNTVDLLKTCRHLKNIGIEVRFEKEGINTLSCDGELMLSLLASFAQEESRSISENVKWGIRKGFEKGKSTHYNVYGYNFNGKEYVILPDQAEVVKRIFTAYLAGGTAEQLEKQFKAEGIPGPKGGGFTTTTIRRILSNIFYTGNSLLQREYIEDHITHKRRKNTGEFAMYLVEGTNPAIISQETYDAVQAEIERRRSLGKDSEIYQHNWYTRKIYCGECGATMRYNDNAAPNGGRRNGYFVCRVKSRKGVEKCQSQHVPEYALKACVAEAMEIPEFTEEAFATQIKKITAYNVQELVLELADGRKITTNWEREDKRNAKRNSYTTEAE